MTLAAGILIPVAVLGLVLGAVLTAADSALAATTRSALERALEDRPARVRRRVLHQHADSHRTLAAVSLGRILAEALMAVAITALVYLWLEGWVVPVLVSLAIASVMLFIGLSVSPRTIGRRRPEAVLISTAPLVSTVRTLLWPPASALIALSSVFTPGASEEDGPYGVDPELRSSVDRALEKQHLEVAEHDMIQGVFDLRDTIVRELMVPRTDMVAIAAGSTAEQAMRLFVRSGFSRIPVVGENVDDLLGMLYVKDVMRAMHSPWDPRPDRPVEEIARRAHFVPEFVSADVVLRQMQTSRVHIAIVVDEYGGVSGIVTIEDVVEEIVGEIADEHDRTEQKIEDLGEGVYRVPAREGVSEVGELFGMEIDDEDVDSIGGLLGKAIGRVPIVGSRGTIHGLQLEAERTTGRRKRLSTVLVSRATGPSTDDDPDVLYDPVSDAARSDRTIRQEDPREQ